MSDRKRQQQQFLVLKQKYVGIGTEKTAEEEWLTNVQRDTYNSLQGHAATLEYVSLGAGSISKRTTKIDMIRKMGQRKVRPRDD
ncbi:hypothetical protein HG535_0G00740 [Zygotorulaspora mrakii]|uniref:Splicing factor subunit n=1 Tax=Zygotorulaspora mrakii TaxID=42260 RepID=A0A7H9B6N0_ZYGMR|nr:uncharacterized protein HG535_0G00740 [Zygotorulaspora mrakii]QLG74190.1 hypothetical protein HG535_0G00740 [Zygotorulaspora mrakii]